MFESELRLIFLEPKTLRPSIIFRDAGVTNLFSRAVSWRSIIIKSFSSRSAPSSTASR